MPDLTSLLVAGARWLTYLSVLLIIGGAGARLVVSRASVVTTIAAIRQVLFRRIDRTAMLGAWLWCVSVVVTLAVQLRAWFGADSILDTENVSVMIAGTVWGQGWQWTAIGSCGALAIVLASRMATPLAGAAITAGALVAALASPLVGHGGSHGNTIWLLHATHLIGAGLWLGSLVVLLRASATLWRGDSPSPDALGALLLAFSPVALTGAGLVAASGLILAFVHVQPLSALFETAFGVTLTTKLAAVALMAVLGYLNWRVPGPNALAVDGRARLRRAAITESILGLMLVLAITAWLSGLPAPGTG